MAGQDCDKYKDVDNSPLDFDNDCFKVVESVRSLAATYYSLGMALGLKSSALDRIRSENPKDSVKALREVIKTWLSRVDLVRDKECVPSSWKTLVEAVANPAGGANAALANQIAAAHPVKVTDKKKQGVQGRGVNKKKQSEGGAGSPAMASGIATKSVKQPSSAVAASGSKSTKSTPKSSPSVSKKEQSADKKVATAAKPRSVSAPPAPQTKTGSGAVSQLAEQVSTTSITTDHVQVIPKEHFVSPPLEESICKKCNKVAREPMHPKCCEKEAKCMLCRPCSEKSKCPYHKKAPESWLLDRALKTRISKWTMKCPNKCEAKFTVSKVDDHLTQCPNAQKASPESLAKRNSH